MGVQLQLCGKMGHFKHKSVLVTVVVVFQMFVSINSQECSSSHTSEADRTSCEPIATIQNLEDRNNYRNGIFTSPDQVLVNRCSGSCRSSGNNYHSCIAKRSQKKSVNVILNHLNGNEPECRTLEIDEHLECQCGCGKSQSDCKSIQDFNPDTCECECRVSDEIRHQCHSAENGEAKHWAEETCDCRCDVREKQCSTGTRYDYIDQCDCVPDVRPASPTITVLLVVALVLALVAAGFLFIKYRKIRARLNDQVKNPVEVVQLNST